MKSACRSAWEALEDGPEVKLHTLQNEAPNAVGNLVAHPPEHRQALLRRALRFGRVLEGPIEPMRREGIHVGATAIRALAHDDCVADGNLAEELVDALRAQIGCVDADLLQNTPGKWVDLGRFQAGADCLEAMAAMSPEERLGRALGGGEGCEAGSDPRTRET